MTGQELIALVARIRYKPHVELSTERTPGHVQFVLHFRRLVDANYPKMEGELRFGSVISEDILSYFNEKRALGWLRERIHEWERHEADEWIRLDGVKTFDPHGGEVLPL